MGVRRSSAGENSLNPSLQNKGDGEKELPIPLALYNQARGIRAEVIRIGKEVIYVRGVTATYPLLEHEHNKQLLRLAMYHNPGMNNINKLAILLLVTFFFPPGPIHGCPFFFR